MELLENNIYNGLDMYRSQAQIVFTRRQIGEALGYKNPKRAIGFIHDRHKEVFDKCSGVFTVNTPGGKQEVFCYNLAGTMRICIYSSQPRAKELLIVLIDRMQDLISTKIAKIDNDYIPELGKASYAKLPEIPRITGHNKEEKQKAAEFIISYFEKNGSFTGIYRAYRLHCEERGEIPIGKAAFDNVRVKIRDGMEYF